MKPLNQGFLVVKLKSSLRKFYGRHHDLVDRYGINKRPRICSTCRKQFPVLSSFMTCHHIFIYIHITDATRGGGTEYPSGAPEFNLGFQWDSCYSIFNFMCMLCRSLLVLLFFFFWPLCCLFFNILITPLVSSIFLSKNLFSEIYNNCITEGLRSSKLLMDVQLLIIHSGCW